MQASGIRNAQGISGSHRDTETTDGYCPGPEILMFFGTIVWGEVGTLRASQVAPGA